MGMYAVERELNFCRFSFSYSTVVVFGNSFSFCYFRNFTGDFARLFLRSLFYRVVVLCLRYVDLDLTF